ncbi:MAG: alanine:cation symporter family protein, partial [Bacteroidota bacterium]
ILYFIGAFAVIFSNLGNIIPSFLSIFSDLFSGTAATGGFLGGTISLAFSKGVGRGLFSNEAGQGSAPIAHASAKGHEPVSEGFVAILEPFIDTIVICTITGLVLLSSGVWNEKHQNNFDYTDIYVMQAGVDIDSREGQLDLINHVENKTEQNLYSGPMEVENGRIVSDVVMLHARSVAEEVFVEKEETPYTGTIDISNGKPETDYTFSGKSLVHSAPLTTIAFTKGFFGEYGKYIVVFGLLMFAFSTAISWSYYGDRAMTFIWGSKSVVYYRIVYVIAFFFAAFTDTTIIWTLSGITIAVMTIPNLIGILALSKDMKQTVDDFWKGFKKEWPDEKTPE